MKIKVQALIPFTLNEFDKITNIVRKGAEKEGMLFKDDIFECDEEMAKYLTGNNEKGSIAVKVIEVMPEKQNKKKGE